MTKNQPFAGRLKEARLRKSAKMRELGQGRYSQERLGIDAGISEETASARMNQYEKGVHLPDLDMAARFAELLDVPMAYLFCDEDDLAKILLEAHTLGPERRKVLALFAAVLHDEIGWTDQRMFVLVKELIALAKDKNESLEVDTADILDTIAMLVEPDNIPRGTA